jgi:hypothetical protein
MARPTRLEIAGGWYHVVNRGIERRAIFRAEGNYEHSLELLAKAVARFAVRVHGLRADGQSLSSATGNASGQFK